MANIYPTTVASKTLVAGDRFAGFFGEVPVSELWSGQELSSLLGITQGTLQHSNEPWLKFIINGKVIYKSKKPFRHSISWTHLNEKGVVYGDKIIEDKYGNLYKVRLMKGALTNPSQNSASDRGAKYSEWNRLMLPIHVQAANKTWKYPERVEPEIPSDWGIDYTNADLGIGSNGGLTWCKETPATDSTKRVFRNGAYGPANSDYWDAGSNNARNGWSPVLELIQRDIFIKDNNTLHTKEGEKPFTQENLTEKNGYQFGELDRKLTTFHQPLASESFYKKSTINLKKYFDIHSIGAGGRLVEKKIDFNMTSNTTPAPYVASASSVWENHAVYQPYKLFNGSYIDSYDVWVLGSGLTNGWAKIEIGEDKVISKVEVVPFWINNNKDNTENLGFPKKIKIEKIKKGATVYEKTIELIFNIKIKSKLVIELDNSFCDSIKMSIDGNFGWVQSNIAGLEVYELVKE